MLVSNQAFAPQDRLGPNVLNAANPLFTPRGMIAQPAQLFSPTGNSWSMANTTYWRDVWAASLAAGPATMAKVVTGPDVWPTGEAHAWLRKSSRTGY